jgi:hypothetical protein
MVNADIVWCSLWRLTFGPQDIHSAPMLISQRNYHHTPSLKTISDRRYLVNMTNDTREDSLGLSTLRLILSRLGRKM